MKSNQIYHVYNRGNNRQLIFLDEENYAYFLRKAKIYLAPYCDILAYSLMPNHFHFLIHANKKSCKHYTPQNWNSRKKKSRSNGPQLTRFSWGLKQLLSTYARGINTRYNRTGSLFQQNSRIKQTFSDIFTEDYSLWCFIYIHNNPKTAGLVKSCEEYKYSSYNDYLLNKQDSICNLKVGRELLSLKENELFQFKSMDVPEEIVKKIF